MTQQKIFEKTKLVFNFRYSYFYHVIKYYKYLNL
jgi:hypothetical protein